MKGRERQTKTINVTKLHSVSVEGIKFREKKNGRARGLVVSGVRVSNLLY